MPERLSLAGEAGAIYIVRDAYGIPHVRAETAAGAWLGMGYACAQDRMFQMDYDRRRADGRWAEIAGPAALNGDILARRLGLAAAAKGDVEVMSAPLREAFESYASGVNRAIADGPPPFESQALGYRIEPWQAWHSVAAFKIRHVLMGQWQHKLAQAVLLARIGPDAFGRLETRPPLGSPLAVPPDRRLVRLVTEALDEVNGHLGFLAEAEPGSNAWAVSGKGTSHGAAVLCNDSHRALDTPNVYWQCHVSCPDFDVTGATFPGLPGFPHFGHNGKVAWAITHAVADTQDLYLERFDGTRYLTEDGWRQAAARTERIDIRGGDHRDIEVFQTRHGPVVHGDPGTGVAIALKYTATYRPDRGLECLLPMLAARDVTELVRAQEGWVDPVNNMIAADTGGHIAYQCRGELPIRSSAAHRRLPVPGWDGRCEWVGTVPFGEMPRVIDPEAGFVMTANNVIVDGDQPYISYTFAQPFRAERIRSRLAGSAVHTAEGLAAMQADTVSWPAQAWSRLLGGLDSGDSSSGDSSSGDSSSGDSSSGDSSSGDSSSGDSSSGDSSSGDSSSGESAAEAARLMLADWDGDLAAGSARALLFGCFRRALAEELYRPVLGDAAWEWISSGNVAATVSLVSRWLANDTWELLGGPVATPSDGGTQKRVLAAVPAALESAWAEAVELGGPDPARWRWGDVHQAVREHPLAGQLDAGALPSMTLPSMTLPSMTLAPVPMGGDADTIQASGYNWRRGGHFRVELLSVYRQVVDLADPGAASYVIPGGSSGDPRSAHFADQLAEWAGCRRVPMRETTERSA